MTVIELRDELNKKIDEGKGDWPICIRDECDDLVEVEEYEVRERTAYLGTSLGHYEPNVPCIAIG
jgi:hypothetical protein